MHTIKQNTLPLAQTQTHWRRKVCTPSRWILCDLWAARIIHRFNAWFDDQGEQKSAATKSKRTSIQSTQQGLNEKCQNSIKKKKKTADLSVWLWKHTILIKDLSCSLVQDDSTKKCRNKKRVSKTADLKFLIHNAVVWWRIMANPNQPRMMAYWFLIQMAITKV